MFGAAMASLTAIALLTPGGALESLWKVNPRAHDEFSKIGAWGIVLMLFVAGVCVAAARGVWTRARWGYRLAVFGLSVNLVADLVSAIVLHDPVRLVGIPIAGAVVAYLLSSGVRSQFGLSRLNAGDR
jgi:uncharacterized membrane protein (DUF2068 family)